MSLVTTASRSSLARVRHRAATSAVLPLPTGPPMPMRTARSCVCVCPSGACGSSCGWLADKESDLPAGVVVGGDVEKRGAVSGQLRVLGGPGGPFGGAVAGGRQLGQQCLDR